MERRAYFRQLLSLCDLFTLAVSFVATCLLYGRVTHNQFWAVTNYAWVLWVIGPVWVLSLRSLGLYQPESYESILSIVSRLVRAQVIAGLMLLSTMYLTKSSEVSRLLLQTFLGLSFVALIAQKAAVRTALQRLRREGAFKRKTLVMCEISQISAYSEMVDANAFWRTEIVGFVIPLEQLARNGTSHSNKPILGQPSDLPKLLSESVVDEVVVILPFDKEETERVATWCTTRGIVFKVFLELPHTQIGRYGAENLGKGAYLLSVNTIPQHSLQLLMKRFLDIVGSMVGLAACGLVYLFYAPRLKRESPGPILFRQQRGGQNGRKFTIYKFRTMYPDAEHRLTEILSHNEMQGTIFKMKNDPRVTPSGKVMRERHLDELPQFWNVFKGEMSLVGARPCPSYEVATYEFHHHRRMSMKPGITGLWQLAGNGEVADFEDVVKLDCDYIDNWSLWLDLQILAKTVVKVVKGTGW